MTNYTAANKNTGATRGSPGKKNMTTAKKPVKKGRALSKKTVKKAKSKYVSHNTNPMGS